MKLLTHVVYELDDIKPCPDLIDFSDVLAEISQRFQQLAATEPMAEDFEIEEFCSVLLMFRYRLNRWIIKYKKEKP